MLPCHVCQTPNSCGQPRRDQVLAVRRESNRNARLQPLMPPLLNRTVSNRGHLPARGYFENRCRWHHRCFLPALVRNHRDESAVCGQRNPVSPVDLKSCNLLTSAAIVHAEIMLPPLASKILDQWITHGS